MIKQILTSFAWFRVLRAVCILVPVLVFGWLLNQYFAFGGRLVTHYSFAKDLRDQEQIISDLQPAGRVSSPEADLDSGVQYRRWRLEPIYFDVFMPRLYEKATVSLTYSNPSQKFISLGLRKGNPEIANTFDFQPLENKIIDHSKWSLLYDQANDISFLQEDNDFKSVQDFFNNVPRDKKVGVFNVNFHPPIILPDYAPQPGRLVINSTLRGRHVFYTYIKDEDLDLHFTWQDINRGFGADPVNVEIMHNDQLVKNVSLADDGQVTPSGLTSQPTDFRLQEADLPEGVYTIIFNITDDVFIRSIDTAQHLFVAENTLFLAAGEDYKQQIPDLDLAQTQVFSDALRLRAQTTHDTGLQVIDINGQSLILQTLGAPQAWNSPFFDITESAAAAAGLARPDITTITVPKNDVQLFANGFYAFTPDSYFNPRRNIVELTPDTPAVDLDYLLFSHYTPPGKRGKWLTTTASFDIRADHLQEGGRTLNFILSAPGLDLVDDDILIRDVTVTLEKKPFSFSKLKDFFARL
ncbi:MAG: hypothetical protein A3F54_05255 [Candidatus Kerfeldbacteria bacterium RIFCSPHIGHO2_12_FULL_48_17]|uniref:Uncharacterized protein n=1 Tax=Candidatus Kerfeldbacteria bacterium RIFCSPHIGHO2_12_FULL_48_17 TaxID=1798542 RepID=A0A1G2B544_9BACT|nr:MAG: hypothetical protein A3F54_05255 [Candidatus Kerfeldbacteria bacterium RIFCSPHIGHO2_12_FULL_48_17]